jgi:hypothetical protein
MVLIVGDVEDDLAREQSLKVVLQGRYKSVARVLQGCYEGEFNDCS